MDIAIAGIELKHSSEQKIDYGTNHFFQVLDELLLSLLSLLILVVVVVAVVVSVVSLLVLVLLLSLLLLLLLS